MICKMDVIQYETISLLIKFVILSDYSGMFPDALQIIFPSLQFDIYEGSLIKDLGTLIQVLFLHLPKYVINCNHEC